MREFTLVKKYLLLQHKVSSQNSRVSLESSVKLLNGSGIAAQKGAHGKGICRNVEMIGAIGTIVHALHALVSLLMLLECREAQHPQRVNRIS